MLASTDTAKDGSRDDTVKDDTTPRPWRAMLAFALLAGATLAMNQVYGGIAKKALGGKANTWIVHIANFGSGILVNTTSPWWSKKLGYDARVAVGVAVFTASIALLWGFLHKSADSALGATMADGSRIAMLMAIILNGAVTSWNECTIMAKLAFYPASCTPYFSTGAGVGGLVGAGWAFVCVKFLNSHALAAGCLAFPVTIAAAYFLLLPRDAAVSSATEERQVPHGDDGQERPTESTAGQGDTTKDTVVSVEARDDGQESSSPYADISIGRSIVILAKLWRFTLPLFLSYALYQLILVGCVNVAYSTEANALFNWCLRGGVFIGKASTQWVSTKRTFVFPASLLLFLAFFSVVVGHRPNSCSGAWLRQSSGGEGLAYGLAVAMGIVYGATSANVYYAVREEVKDDDLREFALGNVRQANNIGQVAGTLLAKPVEMMAPA